MNTEIKNFPRGLKVEDLLYLIYLELKRANDLKESEEPEEKQNEPNGPGDQAVVPSESQVGDAEQGGSSDNSGDSEPTE